MSQLVKMNRQANFKDFKRFGAFRGSSKKALYSTFLCKLGRFRHSCQKKPNLHTNSLNKPLLNLCKLFSLVIVVPFVSKEQIKMYFATDLRKFVFCLFTIFEYLTDDAILIFELGHKNSRVHFNIFQRIQCTLMLYPCSNLNSATNWGLTCQQRNYIFVRHNMTSF
jgi:hypothetical protein